MEYGFYLPNSGASIEPNAIASIAKLGDRLGFFCMVMPDHVLQPNKVSSSSPYSVTGDILEAGQSGDGEWPEQITTLAYLAGLTERIRLVTSVMITPYRHPILTAKMLQPWTCFPKRARVDTGCRRWLDGRGVRTPER
ncbi:MAG: hypothetical protein CM1200mP22_07960 [Dehalococcoidia bacterium]|nr:MAG: hypothetical protein CM1200mP22_07960 [Dehalococcoidia bacterium]